MKKIILSFIFIPSLLFSQWVQQNAPGNLRLISSIDFCDINTGVACSFADREAAYTTDSGVNWLPAQIPDSTRGLFKIQFINNYTGYMAGAYNISGKWRAVSENSFTSQNTEYYRGFLLKTTDAGKTWHTHGEVPSDVYCICGMKFINENTGFVAAMLSLSNNINAILKSTNGGLNWVLCIVDTAVIYNVYTLDGSNVFATGRHYGNIDAPMILKSGDGGVSWGVQFFTEFFEINDIYFPNPSTGFAVSGLGRDDSLSALVFKTTNAGINWVKLSFRNPRSAYESVEFVPGTGKGIAVGWRRTYPQGGLDALVISRTTDYGLNWSNYFIPDSARKLFCSSIADSNVWFVAGGGPSSVVYKTTTGGEPIGVQKISNEVPDSYNLYQNYPNPFNPATTIKFDVPPLFSVGEGQGPSRLGSDKVRLIIYNILGKEVKVLISKELRSGTYEVNWNASAYPSGVYFYKLSIADPSASLGQGFSQTRKMVLIK